MPLTVLSENSPVTWKSVELNGNSDAVLGGKITEQLIPVLARLSEHSERYEKVVALNGNCVASSGGTTNVKSADATVKSLFFVKPRNPCVSGMV